MSSSSERELREFRGRIHELLDSVSHSPEELDYVLGYSPSGRMPSQLLRGRQPPRWCGEKFGELEGNPPPPKPEWLPRAQEILTGEAMTVFMVETGRRQRLEWMAVQAEGEEIDQLYSFPAHSRQVVYTLCRNAWRGR